jgi:hypothetical protein
MKRITGFIFVFAFSCCLHAQAVDTTVCAILQNPQSFNGKIVRIKGTVAAGFDQFVVRGVGCGQQVNDIWLSYPEGIKAKAGPVTIVQLQPARNFAGTVAAVERTPVQLDKNNKDFKQFDSLLSTPFKGDGACPGCGRYTVTATLVGRLDGVAAGLLRDKAGKIVEISGFGNLNAYSARLVLQSISDVTPQEIDYSKSSAATKGESVPENDVTDPVGATHKVAKVFGAGNALGARLERAAAVFDKPVEKGGVALKFGAANQASAKDEGKGETDSPDGLLFSCKLDRGRLRGSASIIATAYAGTLVADIRDPQSAGGITGTYDLEYYAWQTAALGAIGDHLNWNKAWPSAVQDQSLDDGIKGFLGTEELLSR